MVKEHVQKQVKQGCVLLATGQCGGGTENILFGKSDRHCIKVHHTEKVDRRKRLLDLRGICPAENQAPETAHDLQAPGARLCERHGITACRLGKGQPGTEHGRHDTEFRGHGKGIDPVRDRYVYTGQRHAGRRINRAKDGIKQEFQILLRKQEACLPALAGGGKIRLHMAVQNGPQSTFLRRDCRIGNIAFFMNHHRKNHARHDDGKEQYSDDGKYPSDGFFHGITSVIHLYCSKAENASQEVAQTTFVTARMMGKAHRYPLDGERQAGYNDSDRRAPASAVKRSCAKGKEEPQDRATRREMERFVFRLCTRQQSGAYTASS